MTAMQFIDLYESKSTELEILTLLKDSLTPKGMETYNTIKSWLVEHLDQYLEALEEMNR